MSLNDEEKAAASACGFTRMSGEGLAYNEEAFRYFLNIESKRAERSGRPLLLVLIDEKGMPAGQSRLDTTLADELFAALAGGLRETDFLGWYQEHRVAGAVLVQRAETSGIDVSSHARNRVVQIIAKRLRPALADRLQVRVFQLPSRPKGSR